MAVSDYLSYLSAFIAQTVFNLSENRYDCFHYTISLNFTTFHYINKLTCFLFPILFPFDLMYRIEYIILVNTFLVVLVLLPRM